MGWLWIHKTTMFHRTGSNVSVFRFLEQHPKGFLEKVFCLELESDDIRNIFQYPLPDRISSAIEQKYKEILNPPKKGRRKRGRV